MAEKTITITWRAFSNVNPESDPTSLTFTYYTAEPDLELCERIFQETNLYQGSIWDRIEKDLPADRSHTALSVVFDTGDRIQIDDHIYEVDTVGFKTVQLS